MLRRYAFGGLTPPAAAAFIEEPPLIAKYRVGGGWGGGSGMPRNRAERGRQRVGRAEVDARSQSGF